MSEDVIKALRAEAKAKRQQAHNLFAHRAALERYEGLQASLDRVEAGMNAWTLRHIANAFDGLAKRMEEDQA